MTDGKETGRVVKKSPIEQVVKVGVKLAANVSTPAPAPTPTPTPKPTPTPTPAPTPTPEPDPTPAPIQNGVTIPDGTGKYLAQYFKTIN